MTDLSHLDALRDGLAREEARYATARAQGERNHRAVWIAQRQREIADEMLFLGIKEMPAAPMSDDELLAELAA